MATDKTINQFTADSSPTTDDYILVWDSGSGTTKKVLLSSLFTLMESNYTMHKILGRHTLSGTADTLQVTSFTAKKYLMIQVRTFNSGQNDLVMRFNNDSGSTYATQAFNDYAGGAVESAPATSIGLDNATPSENQFFTIFIQNFATVDKQGFYYATKAAGTDASAAPDTRQAGFKWNNSTDQITRIDIINNGTGDMAANSELLITGWD